MKKNLNALLVAAVLLVPCAAFAAEIPTGEFTGYRTFPGQFRPSFPIHWSLTSYGANDEHRHLTVTSPADSTKSYGYAFSSLSGGQFLVLADGDQAANSGSTVCQYGDDSVICLTKYSGLIETDVFKQDEIRIVANSDGHVWTATLKRDATPKP